MAVPVEDHGARVAAVAARHERALLRVARQCSLCDDDALDAYQRALEIFVRRVHAVDPATELAWLRVVVRHEALAIRRARSESVTDEPIELQESVPAPERTVEDQIASGERVRRSAEALRALKPDEAQALMLKAQGLTYDEIAERNGWTYTKVNRTITEGRRRFMSVYEGIESGEECRRFAPIVEALAEGKATSAQILEIRPHLRNCTACRATIRDLHLSRLRRASLFWPLFGIVEPLRKLFERAPRDDAAAAQSAATDSPVLSTTSAESDASPLPDHLTAGMPSADDPFGPEALPAAPDAAPVDPALPVPEATDLGLHLPIEPHATEVLEVGERVRGVPRIKEDIVALLHRANPSDVATGIHIATVTAGGRAATIGTILGLCLSSIGAGTVCVVTGVLPDPLGIVRQDAAKPRTEAPRRAVRDRAPASAPPAGTVVATRPAPTPTPTPRPVRERKLERARAPSAAKDPSQGRKPDSREHAPISPPATTTAGQETFTPEAPPPPSAPAAAPATGGQEFQP